MADRVFTIRLTRRDRLTFSRAARSEGKPLSKWLRAAGYDRAGRVKKKAACLEYTDPIQLSEEAERDPKAFIRSKLKGNGLHR